MESQTYIGTKVVTAIPMSRVDAAILLRRNVEGEGDAPGYLVKYAHGYESWSPRDVFEDAYRPTNMMTFGLAIEALKQKCKVARAGWPKGVYLFLVPGSRFAVSRYPLDTIFPTGTYVDYCPHIDIVNVDGRVSVWAPSPTDPIEEDWVVVD